jgi:hypothetical protein
MEIIKRILTQAREATAFSVLLFYVRALPWNYLAQASDNPGQMAE